MKSKTSRNIEIVNLYFREPYITQTEIGTFYGITRQAIHNIIKRYQTKRLCENCFYFQEFKHCSCRQPSDIVTIANKCSDWKPCEGMKICVV